MSSANLAREIAAAAMLMLAPKASAAQACRTPDAFSNRVLEYVKELVSDGEVATFRDTLGLAGVDSSQVSVVTDSTVCADVAQALKARGHYQDSPGAFVVVRAGPRYVAYRPLPSHDSPREQAVLHFLDLSYTHKDAILAW